MNAVRDVVAVLHKDLHEEQAPTEHPTTMPEPIDHVSNAVQSTQQQLATQLKQMQAIMQTVQIQYSAAPQHTHQDRGGREFHVGNNNFRGRGGHGAQHQGNWIGCRDGQGSSDLTHCFCNHVMCDHTGTE